MKILFLSYGIWEYDGRARELVRVCKQIGGTEYLTRVMTAETRQEESHHYVVFKSPFAYLSFIFKSLSLAFRMGKIDILFVDNRKAVVPAILLRLLKRPRSVVQDVRELYLLREANHLNRKIGCVLEQSFMRKADIVISANVHRATIMKAEFGLRRTPMVYENLRRMEYTTNVSTAAIAEKHTGLFDNDAIRIVSTSGYSVSRMNDKLVEAMVGLGPGYELFLIGGGTSRDLAIIEAIIDENELTNVKILGQLKQDEFKYVVSNCHIGIVSYHQKDMNNKYCASGKIFEFLFEGMPVVTTENIPLKELCSRYQIGIADNNFEQAIRLIASDYARYRQNVIRYVETLDVDKNNRVLAHEILRVFSAEKAM